MTNDLHALILVPARTQYPQCPQYDELVLDWDLLAVAVMGVVAMVLVVWKRRRA